MHDFAFLRFDPGRLQFMEVNEVPLAPEAAVVGLDIRVVGNDSGEKVGRLKAGAREWASTPFKSQSGVRAGMRNGMQRDRLWRHGGLPSPV